ncbi:hypothetical protein [uncultured Litoreibacter sp.]|uniref:hypothetical protein n=1 Tax=uncultured Litoreibacter sp. TaxID=1392394 RepID=UPI00261B2AC2|nr:hypothetical protein [uncultured Litoreibacter sp.]
MAMFIRFVTNLPHPTVDAELGMFAARDDVDFSVQKGSVQRAHDEAFYWFIKGGGGGLTYPRLKGKARTSDVRKSLFWFHKDASFSCSKKGSVVMRARELASVLTLAGCEIREVRLTNPGKIVWDDGVQVLAQPKNGKVPKAF